MLGRRRRTGRLTAAIGALVAAAVPAGSAAATDVPGAVAARAASRGAARVIVRLAVDTAPEARLPHGGAVAAQRRAIAFVADQVRRQLPGPGDRDRALGNLPYLSFEATPADLAALASSPWVLEIAEDRLLAPMLDVSVPLIDADQVQNQGHDGAGLAIAVLDTGVLSSHPTFAGGAVVEETCYSALGDCPLGGTQEFGTGSGEPCDWANQCFHGTHVAGIAAGSAALATGVAPAASLISIQIFSEVTGSSCAPTGEDPCALAFTSDLVLGLQRAHALRTSYDIAAVNVSLGSGEFTSQSSCNGANSATKAAIDDLRAAGIPTVVAAGNNDFAGALAAPACISSAVSVGASSDVDGVWWKSNSASFLSLLAPGVSINSAILSGGFASRTGTSLAAPHVAGSWALLHGVAPLATVDEVLAVLQTTGLPITDTSSGITTPRIQVMNALIGLWSTACSNGLDDDSDGAIDWNGGPSGEPADPNCGGDPLRNSEKTFKCGLGFELAALLPVLAWVRRRRLAPA